MDSWNAAIPEGWKHGTKWIPGRTGKLRRSRARTSEKVSLHGDGEAGAGTSAAGPTGCIAAESASPGRQLGRAGTVVDTCGPIRTFWLSGYT